MHGRTHNTGDERLVRRNSLERCHHRLPSEVRKQTILSLYRGTSDVHTDNDMHVCNNKSQGVHSLTLKCRRCVCRRNTAR